MSEAISQGHFRSRSDHGLKDRQLKRSNVRMGLDRRVAFRHEVLMRPSRSVDSRWVPGLCSDEIGCCSVVGQQRYACCGSATIICAIDSCVRNQLSLQGQVERCAADIAPAGILDVCVAVHPQSADLRIKRHKTVPDQHRPQRRTLIGGGPEGARDKASRRRGHQKPPRCLARWVSPRAENEPTDAVAADQCDLHVLSLGRVLRPGRQALYAADRRCDRLVDARPTRFPGRDRTVRR